MTQDEKSAGLLGLLIKREPVKVTIGGLSFRAFLVSLGSASLSGEKSLTMILREGDQEEGRDAE